MHSFFAKGGRSRREMALSVLALGRRKNTIPMEMSLMTLQ